MLGPRAILRNLWHLRILHNSKVVMTNLGGYLIPASKQTRTPESQEASRSVSTRHSVRHYLDTSYNRNPIKKMFLVEVLEAEGIWREDTSRIVFSICLPHLYLWTTYGARNLGFYFGVQHGSRWTSLSGPRRHVNRLR